MPKLYRAETPEHSVLTVMPHQISHLVCPVGVANHCFSMLRALRYKQVLLLCLLSIFAILPGCASVKSERSGAFGLQNGPVQQALLAQFDQWQGTPYKLGGNSKEGIDCSAFVQQTLATQFNINAPRTTLQQMHLGQAVDPLHHQNLKAGDLLFFQTGSMSHHVGLYLGGGQFIHASTKLGVTLSRLDEPYWKKAFWKVRRVL